MSPWLRWTTGECAGSREAEGSELSFDGHKKTPAFACKGCRQVLLVGVVAVDARIPRGPEEVAHGKADLDAIAFAEIGGPSREVEQPERGPVFVPGVGRPGAPVARGVDLAEQGRGHRVGEQKA